MRAAGICRLTSSRWRLRSRLRPPHGRVTLRNSSIIEMGFTTRQRRWSRKKGWARSCSKAAISTNLLQTSSKSAHEYRRYAWEVGYGSDIAATHDEHFVCCEIETQQAAAPSVRGNWRAIIVWYLSNHQSEGENIKKKKMLTRETAVIIEKVIRHGAACGGNPRSFASHAQPYQHHALERPRPRSSVTKATASPSLCANK